jgi:chorismate synthase
MGNSFGHLFRITTWGESHGGGVGVVIDGCPPRLPLTEADIQPDLDRRRPGQSAIVSPRQEADRVQILSGTFEGQTLGTPISMWVKNEDARPEAYSEMASKFRPSHADYTYQAKFGIRNWQGGGRTSARETIGRVAAGAVAKKILREQFGVVILAYVTQVQRIAARIGSGGGHFQTNRKQHRPLSRRGRGAKNDPPDRTDAAGGRQRGGPDRVRGARRAAGLGRAGL